MNKEVFPLKQELYETAPMQLQTEQQQELSYWGSVQILLCLQVCYSGHSILSSPTPDSRDLIFLLND